MAKDTLECKPVPSGFSLADAIDLAAIKEMHGHVKAIQGEYAAMKDGYMRQRIEETNKDGINDSDCLTVLDKIDLGAIREKCAQVEQIKRRYELLRANYRGQRAAETNKARKARGMPLIRI